MSHTAIGRRAEQAAARFLERKQCTILDRNWRTRYCEIDIIAKRGTCVYLCEVKYRHTAHQGTGLDYITPKKLEQMSFAAEMWVSQKSWHGMYQLCAIEVSGPRFVVTAAVAL